MESICRQRAWLCNWIRCQSFRKCFCVRKWEIHTNNSTFHVTYEDVVLVDIHRQMIESMFALISLPRGKNLDAAIINSYMQELSVSLSVYALRASLFFKHKAYKHEKEYRFFQIHQADMPPKVNQRYRSYELVRYREFDWKRLQADAIKKIIICPAAYCPKATRFAKDCLATFNLKNVETVCSDIPYRAL